jgi:hypothetical protein
MKDFDALRTEKDRDERSFKIAGQVFHFQPVMPAQQYGLYLELVDRWENGRWPAGSWDILNATVFSLLEEDDREAWQKLVASDNGDGAVGFVEMFRIIEHCVEVQSGRPTEQPSPSGGMAESGGTRSTAASASPAAPAPAPSTSEPG